MARLRVPPASAPDYNSDDSLPELASLLLPPLHKKQTALRSPLKARSIEALQDDSTIPAKTPRRVLKSPTKATAAPTPATAKRRILKPLRGDNALLNRLRTPAKDSSTIFNEDDSDIVASARKEVRKPNRSPVKRKAAKYIEEDSDVENVVPELPTVRRARPQRSPVKKNYREAVLSESEEEIQPGLPEVVDLSSDDEEPVRRPQRTQRAVQASKKVVHSDDEEKTQTTAEAQILEPSRAAEVSQPLKDVILDSDAEVEETIVEDSAICDSDNSHEASDDEHSAFEEEAEADSDDDYAWSDTDQKKTTWDSSPSRQLFSEARARTSDAAKSTAGSRPTTASSNDFDAFLQFSPKASRSPRKAPPSSDARPVTPPAAGSKSRLTSPSKQRARVPTPPHGRPSLDAFWDVGTVNAWHDQHSPQKPLLSPRKGFKTLLQHTLSDGNTSSSSISIPLSPTTSPRKRAPIPPSPKKTLLATKRTFDSLKEALATTFLTELDSTITSSQLSALAAPAGGIRLIWTPKLQSTAGRATWRREVLRLKHTDGSTSTKTLHHASIELATKVIDTEERLLNVVAHEFCHLANFMISGISAQPHGKSFREWGRKVTEAFKHRGVSVTMKHTYEIEYKYIWACVSCGMEYKRHSKSVDTKRHSCGGCKGVLEQIKPKPRTGESEYQTFVKKNFARVKKEVEASGEGKGHARVMEVLGREYRVWKESRQGPVVEKKKEEEDGLGGLMEGLKL